MQGRPTLDDVARLAGVHKATASRALNGDTVGMVQAETARRIQDVAAALGYSANTLARGLRTRLSATIGMLVPDLTNPLFPPMVRGAEDALRQAGYTVLLANTDGDPDRERTVFEALIARQVDGVIMCTANRVHPLITEARARGILLVLANRTTDEDLFPAVVGDDRAGVKLLVDHLVALGHTQIAHLGGPASTSPGQRRRAAFRRYVRGHGLSATDAPILDCSAFTAEAGSETMARLLRTRPDITAVIAGNDLIAVGAMRSVRRSGIRCPEDLSLVGFNDMPLAGDLQPPLTTIRVPLQQMGAEAARLLLDELAGGANRSQLLCLPVELVVRESSGPIRRSAWAQAARRP